MPIRVLVVEEHALLREGLAGIIGRAGDLELVGTAGDLDEAVSADHDAGAGVAHPHELRGLDPLVLEARRHADVGDDHLGMGGLRAIHQAVEVLGHPGGGTPHHS